MKTLQDSEERSTKEMQAVFKQIIDDDYDKYDSQFCDQLADVDTLLGMLQEADDSTSSPLNTFLSFPKDRKNYSKFRKSNKDVKLSN